MIVYKVVKPYDGHWCSVVAKHIGLQLLYKVDHVTRPCFGKLFAFREFRDARNFAAQNNILGVVFEADTCKVTTPSGLVLCITDTMQSIIDYWRGKRSGDSTIPKGTVLCDDIKLLRQLTY